MNKAALIVTHHVYLTREQRYQLSDPAALVEVVGVSSPVWVKQGKWMNDTADEIFCTYRLRYSTEPDKNTIRIQPDGYTITLTGTMPTHLVDSKDGGSMSLMLTHRNCIKKKDSKPVTVIHVLSIEDMEVLEQTMA